MKVIENYGSRVAFVRALLVSDYLLPSPSPLPPLPRSTGVPAEHPNVQNNIGMTDEELADLQYATGQTSMNLISTIVLAQKYNWQAFGTSDGVGPGISQSSCISFMQSYCGNLATQGQTMMMQMDNAPDNANQTVSAFLIARPPYGLLGWGWESDDSDWNELFYLQVGEPKFRTL